MRGSLHKGIDIETGVEQHFTMWDGTKIRAFKNQCSEAFGQTAPFNLVTAAIVADRIFTRHPTVKKLNLGLTVYFPFWNPATNMVSKCVRSKGIHCKDW